MEFGCRKMFFKLVLSCIVVMCLMNFVEAKLGDYITICKAKDPNLEKCLISSGHKLFKEMEKGIPEFDIKPVDPMAVPRLGIQRTDIGMSLILTNSTHLGLAQAKIHTAKADPAKHFMEFHLTLPSYSIIGHYDINGKVMLLPINGQGESNITLCFPWLGLAYTDSTGKTKVNDTPVLANDIDVTWQLQGAPEERDGKVYSNIKDFNVVIEPKLMKVNFENLFNGNKLLGTTMNELLNEHWKDIFKQIKPALEKSYSELLMNFATKIFSKTPYNEIFADS